MSDSNKLALGLGIGGAALAAGWLLRRRRHFSLDGKVVLVTGGSRGLGLEIARVLVERSARIAICARDADELEVAEQELRERGGDVIAIPCDLTKPDDIRGLLAGVRGRFGRIDAVINNAGVIQVGPIEHMTDEDLEESLDIYLWAPWRLIQGVLPEMRARGEGRIVNIASVGGRVAVPHLAAYSVGKFALRGLSLALRSELMPAGILVSTITPGLMRTGSHERAQFKGQHRKEYAVFSATSGAPLLTMAAPRAARRIVRALERGEAEVVLGVPAKLMSMVGEAAPGVTAEAMRLVSEQLPGPGGIGEERREGHESHSKTAASPVTRLADRAADRNNERPG